MTDMPFEIHPGLALSPTIILCDHASNRVPAAVGGSLGLPDREMQRHIAYDIGARGVTLALATELQATAILSRFSRLVIDPNRGDDDPTQVMRLYDGTIIAANAHLSEAEIAARRSAFTEPYHSAIAAEIEARLAAGITPAVVSIHSFTPQLAGRPPRPWEIGVLYASDDRMANPLLASLHHEPGLSVGDNEPYNGALEGDCMDRHCISRGLPHVLIEVRNDLIETETGQKSWAERLARHLTPILDEAQNKETTHG